MVEHNLAKVGVAGSNPVFRSIDSNGSQDLLANRFFILFVFYSPSLFISFLKSQFHANSLTKKHVLYVGVVFLGCLPIFVFCTLNIVKN